jgi:hypothetical protein
MRQAGELHTFGKCSFRLSSVEHISLANVNIQNINNFSDINIIDAAKITASVVSGKLLMNFILNVEVKNPNKSKAAMNKLEWILYIDNIEMAKGTLNERIEITSNGGISTLTLFLNFDLIKIFTGSSVYAVMNFGFNLAGIGNKPTRITLKAKPTIFVGNKPIIYPGYIKIRNKFSSN